MTGVSVTLFVAAEVIDERMMLSEPVCICNEGTKTGLNLRGVSRSSEEGSPTEMLQLWAAVFPTVSTRGATGCEFASSTLPMRRVA